MSNVIMGHVRAATVGDITSQNAQPIIFGDTVLTHNGTFRINEYHSDPTRSDSSFFAEDVEDYGLGEVLHSIRGNGAYSIAMYNRAKKKLYFVRNEERPLYFGINQKRNVMYWASERWMLDAVNSRFREVDFAIYEGDVYKSTSVFTPTLGTIFEVDPENIRPRHEILKISESIFYYDRSTGKKYYSRDEKKKEVEEKKEEPPKVEEIKNLPMLQPTKSEVTANILPFLKSKKENQNGVSFSTICGGCGKSLTPYMKYQIKKKLKSGYYSSSSDTYYCECLGSGAMKSSVKSTNKIIH